MQNNHDLERTSNPPRVARRQVLRTAGAGAVGSLLAYETPVASDDTGPKGQDAYESIGVKHVINAAGTLTVLGGSLMPPEVTEAWAQAARHFVDLVDLHDKVGARIAELIGVESAMVTSGAAGAMQMATAAAVTRGDPDLVRRLPSTEGMKNEVITQKSHRTCYDNQITACGVTIVDVETPDQLERAISNRTAMMLFYNLFEPDGMIKREEWVRVARRHGVPTLLDAAADVPPLDALAMYNKMGFDMVAFSGGKALRGPNDTGLLLGRKDLIDAAKRNANPHCGTIGRALKVSKENMIALLAAVERYVRIDHAAEWREWERRLTVIEHALRDIPSLRTERIVPPIANHVPHILLFWDESRVRLTREAVTEKLAKGDPPIALGRVRGTGEAGLLISVFVLQPGEVEIVADRLRGVLQSAV